MPRIFISTLQSTLKVRAVQTQLSNWCMFFAGRSNKNKINDDDNQNVQKRQKKINSTYDHLLDLAQVC